jgi:hypothetical protein
MSLPERVLYATVHSMLRYPRNISAHPILDYSLMAFFSDRWTSLGSVLAMTSLGFVSGSVDSCQRMEMSMLVMVSGVMLLTVDLSLSR